jgi:nitrogen fixation/metabolism regulation signal transduction histidine kinase
MSRWPAKWHGPRLATRLLLAFAAVAFLPLLSVPFVIRQVSQSFDRSFARDLDDAGKLATSELERLRADVRARTQAVIEGRLPEEIARLSSTGESAALLDLAAPAVASSGLDVLEVLDHDGRILLCGQLPVRLGDIDKPALELVGQPTPALQHVLYSNGEEVSSALALVVALPAERFGGGVVLGGRFLDDAELSRLSQLVRGDVTLRSSGAKPASSTRTRAHGWLARLFTPSRRVLDVPLGKDELHIELSDEALVQTKQRIVTGALSAFVLTLLFGIGLAAWLARRTVGPVEALVDGTKRLARGDLGYRVDVKASGEVGELVEAFNRMAGDLASARDRLAHAERIAAWEQIARALAHEIKNPLTPIAMAIETLQRTHDRRHPEFDRFFREGTATVLEEVGRLKRLATEFGEFARWPKPVRSPTSPAEIVRAVGHLYGSLPPVHSVTTDIAPELPLLFVDADQLQRAIVNLVKNALEAMTAGGTVVVRALRSGDEVVIEVADTGPGLSAEVRARMFEPYYTTKPEGTGLGLAIVHRIVTEHGGRLSVEETPGGGATFRMRLPVGVSEVRTAPAA